VTVTVTHRQPCAGADPFYITRPGFSTSASSRNGWTVHGRRVVFSCPAEERVASRIAPRSDALGDLALIEDDRRYLEMRVARLETGMAWGEDPPSRTRHLIGNLAAERWTR